MVVFILYEVRFGNFNNLFSNDDSSHPKGLVLFSPLGTIVFDSMNVDYKTS